MLTIAAIVIAIVFWPVTLIVLAVMYWPVTLILLAIWFALYVISSVFSAVGTALKIK